MCHPTGTLFETWGGTEVGTKKERALVVFAAEVGGRWFAETAQFLFELASAKVRDLPEAVRAWHKRLVQCP